MRDAVNEPLLGLLREITHRSEHKSWQLLYHLGGRWSQINAKTKIYRHHEGRMIQVHLASVSPGKIAAVCRRKGWKAKLWRLAGDLFEKSDWLKRGQYLDWNILAPPPATLMVEMERFGIMPDFELGRPPVFNAIQFEAGYDPFNDVLYVKTLEGVYA